MRYFTQSNMAGKDLAEVSWTACFCCTSFRPLFAAQVSFLIVVIILIIVGVIDVIVIVMVLLLLLLLL